MEASNDPRLAAIATDLGYSDPRLLQSMVIFKQPRIGGEVVAHQDATFLYTDPITVMGFWFALEDATVENGCLEVLPGGHRLGLSKLFRRAEAGGVRLDDVGAAFADGRLPPGRGAGGHAGSATRAPTPSQPRRTCERAVRQKRR